MFVEVKNVLLTQTVGFSSSRPNLKVDFGVFSRVITNKYLLKHPSRNFDVEWGYAFDVHLNAFYPLLVILHFLQLFFINRE